MEEFSGLMLLICESVIISIFSYPVVNETMEDLTELIPLLEQEDIYHLLLNPEMRLQNILTAYVNPIRE